MGISVREIRGVYAKMMCALCVVTVSVKVRKIVLTARKIVGSALLNVVTGSVFLVKKIVLNVLKTVGSVLLNAVMIFVFRLKRIVSHAPRIAGFARRVAVTPSVGRTRVAILARRIAGNVLPTVVMGGADRLRVRIAPTVLRIAEDVPNIAVTVCVSPCWRSIARAVLRIVESVGRGAVANQSKREVVMGVNALNAFARLILFVVTPGGTRTV